MKSTATIVVLLLILGAFMLRSCGAESHVIITVVDEQGKPLAGMPVEGGLTQSDGLSSVNYKGLTNDQGIFNLGPGRCGMSEFAIIMEKPGWYLTRLHPEFERYDEKMGKWLPYPFNVTLVAKPILNPVAMYAKDCSDLGVYEKIPPMRRAGVLFPVTKEAVGFDMTVGDWVAPFGKGAVADVLFRIELVVDFANMFNNGKRDGYDIRLYLSFPNPDGGIQVAEKDPLIPRHRIPALNFLYLPRFATENGYQATREFRKGFHMPAGAYTPDSYDTYSVKRGYFFRVRSRTPEKSPYWYGKMNEDIDIGLQWDESTSTTKYQIQFSYHLNPDGTRNMEFDVNKNLIPPIRQFVDGPEIPAMNEP